ALNGTARGTILSALAELSELGAVELVRLAELVQQPHDLVGMTNGVRRKLRRDHEVDRAPVRLAQIEQPPEERLRKHALAGVPLVGNRDQIRLVAAFAQLAHEIVREDLCPTARERHLWRADRNPHDPASRGTRACCRVPPRPPTNTLRLDLSQVPLTGATCACLCIRCRSRDEGVVERREEELIETADIGC